MDGREFWAVRHLCTFAAVAMLCLASGCHVEWRPYKAEYHGLRPVSERAMLVYDGDLETVLSSGAEMIGSLSKTGDDHARVHAARFGGTHVYFVKAEHKTFPGERVVMRDHYAVLRVPADAWGRLPRELQPEILGKQCRPLPKAPRGCSYTHYFGFMKYDESRVFLKCDDKAEVEDVTASLPPDHCWPRDKR